MIQTSAAIIPWTPLFGKMIKEQQNQKTRILVGTTHANELLNFQMVICWSLSLEEHLQDFHELLVLKKSKISLLLFDQKFFFFQTGNLSIYSNVGAILLSELHILKSKFESVLDQLKLNQAKQTNEEKERDLHFLGTKKLKIKN